MGYFDINFVFPINITLLQQDRTWAHQGNSSLWTAVTGAWQRAFLTSQTIHVLSGRHGKHVLRLDCLHHMQIYSYFDPWWHRWRTVSFVSTNHWLYFIFMNINLIDTTRWLAKWRVPFDVATILWPDPTFCPSFPKFLSREVTHGFWSKQSNLTISKWIEPSTIQWQQFLDLHIGWMWV